MEVADRSADPIAPRATFRGVVGGGVASWWSDLHSAYSCRAGCPVRRVGSSSPISDPARQFIGRLADADEPRRSSTPTAAALLDSLCDLSSVEEANRPAGPDELAALPGHDWEIRIATTWPPGALRRWGTARGTPSWWSAIEELEAPGWCRTGHVGGTEVPVNGARARWVKARTPSLSPRET